MRMITIVGARPQFIKASAVSRRLKGGDFPQITEVIVHTGQHYDDNMSDVFFRELDIPSPTYNLEIGSGTHGEQTGAIMAGLEALLPKLKPDLLLVYGDTNSTLAAALVAAKAGVVLAHVEAGLRSGRRAMAEEVNRVVTDRLADLLFCPTEVAVRNLAHEGRSAGVYLVGDVMLDIFTAVMAKSDRGAALRYGLEAGRYALATVHRAENTDDPLRLASIFAGLGDASTTLPVLLPLHPRTARALACAGLTPAPGIKIVAPLPYAELVGLTMAASVVATDSGGLQKEAYFAGVPCVTLRDETEWTETVTAGWNRLAPPSADPHSAVRIGRAILEAAGSARGNVAPPVYGNGDAAGQILETIGALA